ncbi:erythromycin esterase family protein [Streptomyces sp. JNUCC 64]
MSPGPSAAPARSRSTAGALPRDSRSPGTLQSPGNPRRPRLRRTVPVLLAATVVAGVLTGGGASAAGPGPAPRTDTATTGKGGPSARNDGSAAVVEGVERLARPLRTTAPDAPARDLAGLVRTIGDAEVVGVGEATHGSKELFQLKDRLFRRLAGREGFTTFALETSWSSGVRLDAYVRTGKGDLRRIMREEFQGSYADWNNAEFLRLFTWMREHNRTAAPGQRLRVMGNDVNDVDHAQYRRIVDWAAEHRPALAPRLRERYAAALALPAGVAERTAALSARPRAEREAMAADARAVHALLTGAGGVDPLVLQESRVIVDMASLYALDLLDPTVEPEANRLRDRAMAEHTVWWQRWTGGRVLVSAHNAHLAYETPDAGTHPVVQGTVLRELIGDRYLAVGTSVHSARYRAHDHRTGLFDVFDTGPAAPGSNEHVLDRVRPRGARDGDTGYYVDLRAARHDRAAGPWLATARPMFVVPGGYGGRPEERLKDVAPGRAFDVLVHLRRAVEYGEVG